MISISFIGAKFERWVSLFSGSFNDDVARVMWGSLVRCKHADSERCLKDCMYVGSTGRCSPCMHIIADVVYSPEENASRDVEIDPQTHMHTACTSPNYPVSSTGEQEGLEITDVMCVLLLLRSTIQAPETRQ